MTNWKILTLDRDTSDGFVTTAHWIASQTDGDFSASTYSTVSFTKGGAMAPYAGLTEATVIGWVSLLWALKVLPLWTLPWLLRLLKRKRLRRLLVRLGRDDGVRNEHN